MQPRIIVIEDNAILARAIGRILAGYDVTVEIDSQAALARIVDAEVDGVPFDVVICDAHMPNKSGFDVLAATRALHRAPVFVMISGEAEIADADADAVLVKPFAPQELRALILSLLAARRIRPLRA